MNKGVSEIVVIILILMIGISMAGVLYIWAGETAFNIYPEESQQKEYLRQRACLGINELIEDSITINNCGAVPLEDFKVYVNEINLGVIDDPSKLDPGESGTIYLTIFPMILVKGDRIYATSNYAQSPVVTYRPGGTPYCGNGIIEAGEECDDENTDNCDGCLDDCTLHTNICGDGYLCDPEECDDGNADDGDGCSSTCIIETGIDWASLAKGASVIVGVECSAGDCSVNDILYAGPSGYDHCSSSPGTITIDLGAVRPVSTIDTYLFVPDSVDYLTYGGYAIYFSVDDTNWDTIVDYLGTPVTVSRTMDINYPITNIFTLADTRYIKYIGKSAPLNGGGLYFSIDEVNAYG